ncbi:probable F-box protein At5g04010 [Henckelia pumila]|uniref:probable F-box protein At5g04010 n=1 Tax=Henckelia pumila TaxID=405737 RepID=UPI003C6E35A0
MEPKCRSLEMKSSLPWQILDLVAHFLDPKSLATAVCVCKSWAISMSSDHLWQPFFSSRYPSLANLTNAAISSAVSYHKLYSLGHASEKRRHQPPPKPGLSLRHLIFSIDIRNPKESILTVVKPGGEVKLDRNGSIFRFDIDVETSTSVGFEALNGLKITWNVVLEGFRSVFTMMDCEGKGSSFVMGLEGWFSKELPSAGCCSGGGASGLVVDLRVGLRDCGGKVAVEKMSLGVLSIVSWRYVSVDEVLRYLQHFLLPSNM